MRTRLLFACFSLGILALVLLWTGLAAAQSTSEAPETQVALNRFEPSFAGDRMFGVQSPFAAGDAKFHAGVFGDYSHDPLVLRDAEDEQVGGVVSRQFFLHFNATLALFDRLSFNVNVPLAVYQKGGDPEVGGVSYDSPDAAELGDVRFGARVRVFGQYFDAFQLAVGGLLWMPTSPEGSYVGEKSMRAMPQLILGGLAADTLVWSLNVGSEFRPETELLATEQGSMLRYGAGLGVLLGDAKRLLISGEYSGGFVYEQIDEHTLNGELLVGARYRIVPDVELGAGAGPGLSSGIGTPDFRTVFVLAYTPMQKRPPAMPPDRDVDGVLDPVDACPDEPGRHSTDPSKNGCLVLDSDGDGVLDKVDACPDERGVASDDPAKNGCPRLSDRDGDGVIDGEDACPDTKGVPSEAAGKNGCPPDRDGDDISDVEDACPDRKGVPSDIPEQHGCPPDTDGDSFRDDQDACPFEKGPDDADPTKRGCPTMVRVTDKEIVILQQVLFDTGRATIKPESFPLIDEVVGALKDHPEIVELRVEGHTDSRGAKAFNMRLSQNRAESVMKALVQRGIEPARLKAQGFGPTEPIGDNATEEGRQKNRRVQFTILGKKDAWDQTGAPALPAVEPTPEDAKP
ncbi:MAG TPA: OmpA family protein [Polyangiaceae bacterium]